MLKPSFLPILLLFVSSALTAQSVDDTQQAQANLEKLRTSVRSQARQITKDQAKTIKQLLDLGLWPEATDAIKSGKGLTPIQKPILLAEYQWLNNDFKSAEKEVSPIFSSSL